MTAQELIDRFRMETNDTVVPPFWSDAALLVWLAEAEEEAAVRSNLIHESELPEVCIVPLTPGVSRYALHPKVTEITAIRHYRVPYPFDNPHTLHDGIALKTPTELDQECPGWRHDNPHARHFHWAIHEDKALRLVGAPRAPGTLRLECYRLPLVPLETPFDEPEIGEPHHRHLIQWVLHRAYLRPDSETYDPGRSERALAEFERHFGLRVTADMRRLSRTNAIQRNALW